MNIIFLSREYPPELHGGIGTYTYVMAHALAEAGHGVDVIAWTDGEEISVQDDLVTVHRVRPYLVKPLCQRPLRWLHLYDHFPAVGDWIGWSYAAYRRVRGLQQRKRIDVIEAPDNTAHGYASSFIRDIPLIVKFHNPRSVTYEQIGHEPWRDERLGLRFEKWAVNRATLMMSPSQSLANLLATKWRFNAEEVHVIPNPINGVQFRPSPPNHPASFEAPIVLYVGSLGRTKGTRILIDAMAQVLATVRQARMRLIGGTRSDRDIQDATYEEYVLRRWGPAVAERIKFVGRVPREELVKEYQGCAVAVVPSVLFDNFPTTCLEAMACGRPVVGTLCGGIPEMIVDGVTGLLVPPDDVDALAQALIRILENPDQARAMGEAGRQRVEEHFAVPVILRKTLEVYALAQKHVQP